MPGRTATLLLGVACSLSAFLGAVAVAPSAAAAPPFVNSGFKPVVGDLTGDGIADRTTLGTRGRVCGFQLAPGLGRGQFGAPVTGTLPVDNDVPEGGFRACPNLGTVLKGPSPSSNQLAVTWFDFGPYDGPQVQTFRGFASGPVRNTGGFNGIYQASYIASRDIDGDGYGDVYEGTDQGGPTSFFVGRGRTWRSLDLYPREAQTSSEQFFDLNLNRGTDILTVWSDGGGNDYGAAAVDGRTGAVQVLGRAQTSDPDVDTGFAIFVVDVNHDLYPDLRLATTVYDAGTQRTTYTTFVNQSQGGRWYFRALTS